MIHLIVSEVIFRGGYLEYFPDSGLVILYDSAYVKTSEGVELFADTIRYWKDLNIVEAKGRFLLRDGKSQTTGEYLKYNIDRGTGLATKSRSFIEKGWVEGDTIYKTSENSVYVLHGSFTTCELEKPHYSFVSSEMRVIKKDLAVVKPLVFFIRDIPVLAAPFWFLPVGKDRSSGFLPPSVGRSSQDGLYIRNLAFYLVINNFQDITVSADIIENRGVRFSAEYVYNVYKLLKGGIDLSYAYDLVENEGRRRRWSLKGDHSQNLLGFDVNAHGDFISDAMYIQDYAEVKDKWVQSELVSYITARRKIGSYGLLSINAYNRYDPLRNTTERRLPEIGLSLLPLNIFGLSFSNSANYTQRIFIDSLGNQSRFKQLSTSHNLSTTYNITYLSLSPSFDISTTTNDSVFVGKVWGFNLPISTTLYGVSLFGIGPIKKFRHIFKPSVSYFYRSVYDTSKSQGLMFSVDNTYEYKMIKDTTQKTGTFLQWGASAEYLFEDTLRDKPLMQRITPVNINVKLTPVRKISATVYSTYDHINSKFYNTQIIFNFGRFSINEIISLFERKPMDTLKDTLLDTLRKDTVITEEKVLEMNKPKVLPWEFGFTYTFAKADEYTPIQSLFRITISGNLTKHWNISYNATYDYSNKRFLDQSINIRRDLHCWVLEGRWSWFSGISVYDVRIYVKAIPEIALKRGVLDILLPK